MTRYLFAATALATLGIPLAHAQQLAATPPMGWNSWNHFESKIDDRTVRAIADALVSTGMKDAGYIYINIDDTWEDKRDANGTILTNSKFPDMKALADYVHSKGLKIGIYSSPGPKTCADYEGSYKHEVQDAKTYAAWGIDYLKYDWCSADKVYPNSDMPKVYKMMADALKGTGRPIVFSLCQYGIDKVWEWGASAGGNLWRTTGDISDKWQSMEEIGFKQNGLEKFAGPGHWNDPDMLEVGNGGMSATEYRTHMSLWCLLAAPLLAGNDIRSMSPETVSILTNREAIAIDQDSLGKQGYRVAQDGATEVWAKALAGNQWAVGLFNRGPEAVRVTVHWKDLGLTGKHAVRDLWAHKDRGSQKDQFWYEVPSHGVVLLRVK
jgi:alpha-galactosidase